MMGDTAQTEEFSGVDRTKASCQDEKDSQMSQLPCHLMYISGSIQVLRSHSKPIGGMLIAGSLGASVGIPIALPSEADCQQVQIGFLVRGKQKLF